MPTNVNYDTDLNMTIKLQTVAVDDYISIVFVDGDHVGYIVNGLHGTRYGGYVGIWPMDVTRSTYVGHYATPEAAAHAILFYIKLRNEEDEYAVAMLKRAHEREYLHEANSR